MKRPFTCFWTSLDANEKRALAKKAKTSVAYLSQIACGHRNAGTKTINSLIAADERVTLAMFFKAA